MRRVRPILSSVFALAALFACSGEVRAFHEGGVLACANCHTMHNSQNGQAVDPGHPGGDTHLLRYGNSSDTCLRCHAAFGQFAGGFGYGPGGDFYWLTRSYTWIGNDGTPGSSPGHSHGHNVIAPAYGLIQDPVLPVAPGGDFPSQHLGCTSCHDPHGNTNYMMLYGAGGASYYNGQRASFTDPAPLAVGNGPLTTWSLPCLSCHNIHGAQSKANIHDHAAETDARHPVYKSGVSEWCANCHGFFHDEGLADFEHPTREEFESDLAGVYNAYLSSDDQLGGDAAHSYWGLVPFEAVNVDLATVNPQNRTQGPTAPDRVMCLSCHRAHASPFPRGGRWDFTATFIADSHPRITDTGASTNDVANRYYRYAFVTTQGSLCRKCHPWDMGGDRLQ
ncbi:MAG: hypothetical protein C0395_06810 [Gemmatimonas sp.]|nr:hypothetical protein [Gemmatimonas sp.]